MDALIFLTDRYPFGKGEAFIENEVPYLAQRFDKVVVVPTALTVSTDISREVPDNFVILPPANTDDLYKDGRPGKKHRVLWSLRHMVPWCFAAVFSKDTFTEIIGLIKSRQCSFSRCVSVIRTIAPVKRNRCHFRKYRNRTELQNADNVYIYSYWLNQNVVYISKALGIQQESVKKTIARSHGYDLYSERRSCGYIPFQKNTIDFADDVCLISKDGIRYLAEKYPAYSFKFRLNYLGTRDYGSGPYVPDNTFHIVSCSYVIPVKRVTRIIDALDKITERKIKWTHFGAGQDFERLQDYAKVLQKHDNIIYELKGQVFNRELMNYYQQNSVDAFVNVSESEGLPVSIMEAISFGIPVIATDVGGTTDAVLHGKNGWLLPIDFSDEEFASKIESMMTLEPNAYLAMRQYSRTVWEERFCESRNYSQFIKDFFNGDE